MSSDLAERIRVDVIIPLRDNDGNLIDINKHKQTKDDIVSRFGDGTFLISTEGAWTNHNENDRAYVDVNTSFFVVVDNTEETINFFKEYKMILAERYNQKRIYINYYPVNEL